MSQSPPPEAPRCPACQRIVYARRLPTCEFCHAPLPASVRLSAEERAASDAAFAEEREAHREWQERRAEREQNRPGSIGTEPGIGGGQTI